MLHVHFVQDYTEKIFIDDGGRSKSVLNDIDLSSAPLDDQEIPIDQLRRHAHINKRSQWWQIDYDVIITFA
jgi:hypothetical protein